MNVIRGGTTMDSQTSLRERACKVLRDSFLFGNLKETVLCGLVDECTELYWKKGDTVDVDGSRQYLHIIVSGRIKVTQIDPESGRSLALFLLKEGDIFDVFSLLDGKEHIVFPVPLDHMELLSIPLLRAREWMGRNIPRSINVFFPILVTVCGNLKRSVNLLSFTIQPQDLQTLY